MANTKIKAKVKDGITEVKALSKHEMLSYQEAQRAKKEVNFITYYKAEVNGKIVFEASTSQFISKDPYMKFSFKGANKGDKVVITTVDLKGTTDVSDAVIK